MLYMKLCIYNSLLLISFIHSLQYLLTQLWIRFPKCVLYQLSGLGGLAVLQECQLFVV